MVPSFEDHGLSLQKVRMFNDPDNENKVIREEVNNIATAPKADEETASFGEEEMQIIKELD